MSGLKINPSFEKSAYEPIQEKFLIGIDPGTKTGLAAWDTQDKKLMYVGTYEFFGACEFIRFLKQKRGFDICLVIEDARKRKWFGQNADAKRMGAGSVKRDCKLWEDFCNREGIPFRLVHPKRGATKYTSSEFQIVTGWRVGPPNTHVTRPCW
ncbi:hypothetical protein LEP1GSC158_0635 [Leptospira interrogans serovar Zanoni str. LT2156]|uniref:Uncharacterized protein n=1 Tax=Leptospira interrogans serovar Zanoni str. LT2156 TaxID=1001601 RepID=M6HFX1_LEPIR|nr:hypothetical protein LEP1GSC158_0635 [Leptospira interrogans serovar Zanoni str. LT2156]